MIERYPAVGTSSALRLKESMNVKVFIRHPPKSGHWLINREPKIIWHGEYSILQGQVVEKYQLARSSDNRHYMWFT